MSVDVEAVRRRSDIVDVVSRYVELKKRGAEYVGLCPFHADSDPSLNVHPGKQVWACFSCGAHEAGADVFGFVMKYDDCTFPQALEKLSNGQALPDAKPIQRPALKRPSPREMLIPPDDSKPEWHRRDFGMPVKVWTICTPEGKPWYYEARYLVDGVKETRFYTWGRYSEQDPPRWECKHPPNPRPFYGLDALAAKPDAQVMIHEAPKKAEAGAKLLIHQVHLGMIGGAHQVANMDVAPLAGRKVILLPDNDEAGKQAMKWLAARLVQELGLQVKGIDPDTLPDGTAAPEGWDIADAPDWTPKQALAWAKARTQVYEAPVAGPSGGTSPASPAPESSPIPAQIAPSATISPEPLPTPRPVLTVVDGGALRKPVQEFEPEPEQIPAFSEVALAKRFAAGPGRDWCYTPAWSMWAKWVGHRWEPDECRSITWEVQNCCIAAMQEHMPDSTPSQRMKITTLKTVNAVAGLAGSNPALAVQVKAWDANPMLLGTPAGVIDLRAGEFITAERTQMISKSTTVAPVAGEHPWWDKVLERAHRGNQDLLEFIQRWCGYLLTGDTREERFLFIHGPGAGGKSKFLEPLSNIMGDYRRTAKIDSFTARERSEHSEEIARLAGARLVTATETEEGSRWNESRITALTGRDAIAARHMHKSTFEFQPQFKLVFIGNHRPALRSVGEEMKRRIDLIEWGGTIPEADRVLDLPDRLRAEYPAILHWMIQGCLAWQRIGLQKPQPVESATREYLSAEDTLGAWLDECCIVEESAQCRSSAAYSSFKRWAEQAGEYVPSRKRFSQSLLDRGFRAIRSSVARQFGGLRIKDDDNYVPDYDRN